MDECLELCSDYIALFENKQFWKDISVNHRKTIWLQNQQGVKNEKAVVLENDIEKPRTADPSQKK